MTLLLNNVSEDWKRQDGKEPKKEFISIKNHFIEHFNADKLLRLAEFHRFLNAQELAHYLFQILQIEFEISYLHLANSKLKYHLEFGEPSLYKNIYSLRLEGHVIGSVEFHSKSNYQLQK